MTSEVEQRPRLVMGGDGWHGSQRVKQICFPETGHIVLIQALFVRLKQVINNKSNLKVLGLKFIKFRYTKFVNNC